MTLDIILNNFQYYNDTSKYKNLVQKNKLRLNKIINIYLKYIYLVF